MGGWVGVLWVWEWVSNLVNELSGVAYNNFHDKNFPENARDRNI